MTNQEKFELVFGIKVEDIDNNFWDLEFTGPSRDINADKLLKDIEAKTKRLKDENTINGLLGAIPMIYDQLGEN